MNGGKGAGPHMPGLDEIYEQYRGELFRYLLRLTGSAAQAEDLVSETFLKALQNLHTLKKEEALKAWLFSVARHAWLDWLRARRETVELSDLLGLYLADEAPTRAESRALLARVEQLLQQKTPRDQAVFRLRLQGYAFSEIGRALGFSESAARVVDHRLRRWLNEQIKEGEL